MTEVIAFVRSAAEVLPLVTWSARFAQAIGADTLIVAEFSGAVRERTLVDPESIGEDGDRIVAKVLEAQALIRKRAALPTAAGWHPGDPVPDLALLRLPSTDGIEALWIDRQVRGARLLVYGNGEGSQSDRLDGERLMRRLPCETLWLRSSDANECAEPQRILVPIAGGPNAELVLRHAANLAAVLHGEVHALIVEPRGGDAETVGRRRAERRVRRTVERHRDLITVTVAVSNDPVQAITDAFAAGDYQLLLAGASPFTTLRRFFSRRISDHLHDSANSIADVGVMRKAVPLGSRIVGWADQFCSENVPQLDREGRLDLTERLRDASSWNFDFVALVCLSTTIASIGLIRNSVAVVIGAMLVAPLMTPLVGSGLAIVQGNAQLLRSAGRALALGFLLAFLIGVAAGLLSGETALTTEMLARGEPGGADLVVAIASGLAAAYATARPGLSGAIPGVAIAAALVPPIATSGIACSLALTTSSSTAPFPAQVGLGAFLLFFVNIVAIVVSAAVSLFAVGVRIDRDGRRPWQLRLWLALLILAAVTVVML